MNHFSKLITAAAVASSMFAATVAQAHGIWFAERSSQLAIVYGIGADDLDMVKRLPKIVSFTGYDDEWKKVDAELMAAGPVVIVAGDDFPAGVSAVMDNGVWSWTPEGEILPKGRDEVPNAVRAERTVKYAVAVRGMLPKNFPNLKTQRLQIIPVAEYTPALVDGEYDMHGTEMPVEAGDHLKVKVVYEGKPVAGAKVLTEVVTDPDAPVVITDKDGFATIRVRNQGLNVVGALYDGPSDEPKRFDKIEHFATLSFVLPHLPE